ncbi:Z1 domain-containing protein [Spiroplasma alleghenense]|uniref:Endonuclease Z1 domain-containing protein n=1 Tax=Spiroplasma alleghenense TaxID=216931 RepID=A0A345Z598_9MOLU|nr:Z1 domain-containing protein [Spiroplasma alleghenense]AXK51777.1 hypothetical protein SALLE_v1c11070 [Spiroplasma alleghenense]
MENNFNIKFDWRSVFQEKTDLAIENKTVYSFIQGDNSYFSNFVDDISSGGSESYKNIILGNIQNIVHALQEVDNLLVVGNVQSGKTNNILGLISASLSKKYDIVVLLGGTTNLLLKQTQERLEKIRSKNSEVLFLDKDNLKSISIVENLEKGVLVFFNILKSEKDLKSIYKILENVDLSNKKVLIIDDESDFGSVNIGKPMSKIYEMIGALKSRTDFTKIVSFTATPFANILSRNSEILKPHRIITLNQETSYTGLEFFQKNSFVYDVLSTDRRAENEWGKIIYQSLKYYVFNSACFNINNKIRKRTDLIINISLEKESHIEINKIVASGISKLKRDYHPEFFENFFEKQISEINKLESGFFIRNKTLIKKELDLFIKSINRSSISILNSDFMDKSTDGDENRIYIGGGLISRGFTFPNLLVEVMINAPQNKIQLDTLLQRARWFGYRQESYRFMKILINNQIWESFKEGILVNGKIYEMAEDNVIRNLTKLENELRTMDLDNCVLTGGKKT